jgi:RNA polymerase sigma-70 factor (ECF subfamily)
MHEVTMASLTMTATTSESLSTDLRDGDEVAFDLAYRTHGPSVRAYICRFVPIGEADDLTQQTFLELWKSRDRIDPTRPLIGLLLGIARRRSIDHLRKRRTDPVDMTTLRELSSPSGDALIDQLVYVSEIEQGLAQLSEEQREVLVLSYFGELSQSEIADQLGIPLGTVKARMARGMAKLAERLDRGVLK